jgi:hypothetical protein
MGMANKSQESSLQPGLSSNNKRLLISTHNLHCNWLSINRPDLFNLNQSQRGKEMKFKTLLPFLIAALVIIFAIIITQPAAADIGNTIYLPLVIKMPTPAPTATPIVLKSPTPTTKPTSTSRPNPTATTASSGPCNCTGPDLNCSDFGTHNAAQVCFNYCWNQGYGDVFNLDRDGNGLACESLP